MSAQQSTQRNIQRVSSIIAIGIFAAMFFLAPGYFAKGLALGFIVISIVWLITGWTTSIYAKAGEGAEAGAQFDVGSLLAGLIILGCAAGGVAVMFGLSQIAALKTLIG